MFSIETRRYLRSTSTSCIFSSAIRSAEFDQAGLISVCRLLFASYTLIRTRTVAVPCTLRYRPRYVVCSF